MEDSTFVALTIVDNAYVVSLMDNEIGYEQVTDLGPEKLSTYLAPAVGGRNCSNTNGVISAPYVTDADVVGVVSGLVLGESEGASERIRTWDMGYDTRE